MPMMQVLAVVVVMLHRSVAVLVCMWADGHRVMDVGVVTIVVGVGVRVADGDVDVRVPMSLEGMKPETASNESAGRDERPAGPRGAQSESDPGPEERRDREDRGGACGADPSLGPQIELQAQAVPDGADGEVAGGRADPRPRLVQGDNAEG